MEAMACKNEQLEELSECVCVGQEIEEKGAFACFAQVEDSLEWHDRTSDKETTRREVVYI
jgi:hypothetical protein